MVFHLNKEKLFDIRSMLETAYEYGLSGNLYTLCLTEMLLKDVNPFALSFERRPGEKDSMYEMALQDMEIISELLEYDSDEPRWKAIFDFQQSNRKGNDLGELIMRKEAELRSADSPGKMLDSLLEHILHSGAGVFGMSEVFRVAETDGKVSVVPLKNRRKISLDELVGYESQKETVEANTRAFLRGERANNMLLYGDAGTGKSTCIQAISHKYAADGLRLVEIYKDQFHLIPQLLNDIKNRNYRFILFMDDLSFEENEVEYKYLKAVMEGGAEAAPENVRIYATSNRRHLIKETWKDRNDMEHDGDIHRSETMEEKLSLSSRFGVRVYFPNPDFNEYLHMVTELAGRENRLKDIPEEEIRKKAATWQVRSGTRSGRTARQFIDYMLSRQESDEM